MEEEEEEEEEEEKVVVVVVVVVVVIVKMMVVGLCGERFVRQVKEVCDVLLCLGLGCSINLFLVSDTLPTISTGISADTVSEVEDFLILSLIIGGYG